MDYLTYDFVKAAFQKILPQLKESDLKLVVDKVFMHLAALERDLLFNEEEKSMVDSVIAIANNNVEMQQKLANIFETKFAEFSEVEQTEIAKKVYDEMIKKGHEIYKALS